MTAGTLAMKLFRKSGNGFSWRYDSYHHTDRGKTPYSLSRRRLHSSFTYLRRITPKRRTRSAVAVSPPASYPTTGEVAVVESDVVICMA